MRVLFFVEGFTDIRFVVGLSEICDLTLAVPAAPIARAASTTALRESGARVRCDAIEGGRAGFQLRSLRLSVARGAGAFDVVLAQEMLRGALNATRRRRPERRAGRDLHGHLADRVLPLPARAGPDRRRWPRSRGEAGHPRADVASTAGWPRRRW